MPYLYFDGNCREAMEFYMACFGGDLRMQAVKETPMANQFPPQAADKIMHAELKKDDLMIMSSDFLRGSLKAGSQIELLVNCSSEAELRSFFDALAAGGNIVAPVRTEFWGSVYGKLTDKFGISWSFNFGH